VDGEEDGVAGTSRKNGPPAGGEGGPNAQGDIETKEKRLGSQKGGKNHNTEKKHYMERPLRTSSSEN